MVILNLYPFPLRLNFDDEDENGEYQVDQVQLLPGQTVEMDEERWASKSEKPVIRNGIDKGKILVDAEEKRVRMERARLGNNLLDRSLIGSECKPARDHGYEEVAQEEVERAERVLRKARQASGSITANLSPSLN